MIVNFNAELRGITQKTSQKTNMDYLMFHMEDEEGQAFDILSKNMTLGREFKKGDLVKCKASLVIGQYTKFELVSISK